MAAATSHGHFFWPRELPRPLFLAVGAPAATFLGQKSGRGHKKSGRGHKKSDRGHKKVAAARKKVAAAMKKVAAARKKWPRPLKKWPRPEKSGRGQKKVAAAMKKVAAASFGPDEIQKVRTDFKTFQKSPDAVFKVF